MTAPQDRDLIARLIQEHQDYVFKLSDLAIAIEGIRTNGRGNYFIETVDGLLPALTVELDDHARREEDLLFPVLMERVPDSPVPVMLEEHAAIREASRGFDEWYRVWRDGDDQAFARWAEYALTLRGTFSVHMQKENLMLFPMARRVLTPDELRRLTARS